MADKPRDAIDTDGLLALLARMPQDTGLTETQKVFLLELQAAQRARMGEREPRRQRVTAPLTDNELARLHGTTMNGPAQREPNG
ncbi:MAG TPA: hypothetical protein VMW47_00870 [Verrucomicrobiae bacterium]|nr:hypothetical protein [Verrucomicrobiae bacterium]